MSLIELLVSIALVSIVLTLLFALLSNIRNEKNHNDYAYNNELNKTDIIFTLQKDLNKYNLVGIKDESSNQNLVLKFYYKVDEDLKVATNEKKSVVSYTDVASKKYSWNILDGYIDPCVNLNYHVDREVNSYYFKINMYVYNNPENENNNEVNNNPLDDLEFSYTGNLNNLNIENGYLMGSNNIDKKIGACTN